MKVRTRKYSGTTSQDITKREIKNRELSRQVAGEGVVLLKNNGILPIMSGRKLALFGNGMAEIIKGGTGSGDVNVRNIVSVIEGMEGAGYKITNKADVTNYMDEYEKASEEWRLAVLEKVAQYVGSDMAFLSIPSQTPRRSIEDIPVDPEKVTQADGVVYVLSRVAGEGQDRHEVAGDYYISQKEISILEEIYRNNTNIIIVINAGAQVDLLEWTEKAAAIVYLSQPGMEAGNVLADVISGAVNPSGKLTSTWAKNYKDFSNADTFSHCNGNVDTEKYEEGVYVGYRYFDSFGIEPLYSFGYGLSYTSFTYSNPHVEALDNQVIVSVEVKNSGDKYSGKQVIQVYTSCPQNSERKELKRLVGFVKTDVLAPNESQKVTLSIEAKMFASYIYEKASWIIDAGEYPLFIGGDVQNSELAGVLMVENEVVLETVEHISPCQEQLQEIVPPQLVINQHGLEWQDEAKEVIRVIFSPRKYEKISINQGRFEARAKEIVEKIDDDQLISILMGEISKGQDNVVENELVKTGIYVPGAAGETTNSLEKEYGIPGIVMADGPAGLRLCTEYDVDNETGLIYGIGLFSAICGPKFATKYKRKNVTTYYMYSTAIPVGTMLAQTWNVNLIEQIGEMVGHEMREFGVSWWLAPGMNIQRNPLCGRNFEYYSEDPLVSGKIAAAMTRGVQKVPGAGTTIKHFAANNQEDNRLFSNSVVSERALREIYLRGFEIAIKESQPMCLMSSYNLINSVPAANNSDLLNKVLREEWGYTGIVMSDWTTTTNGAAQAYMCPAAGNDLIMPGNQKDIDNIKSALKDGRVKRDELITCAIRLVSLILEINDVLQQEI